MSESSSDKHLFNPVEPNPKFPEMEEQVLEFWNEQKIYDKSLERRKGSDNYVSSKVRRQQTVNRTRAIA